MKIAAGRRQSAPSAGFALPLRMLFAFKGSPRVLTLTLLPLVAACGGSTSASSSGPSFSQNLAVQGHAAYSDGTPMISESMEVQVTLSLTPSAVSGANCKVANSLVQISSDSIALSDGVGGFQLTLSAANFSSGPANACPITQLTPGEIQGIQIHASVPQDDSTCGSYCSAAGGSLSSCLSDCESPGRFVTGIQRISGTQISQSTQVARDGTVIYSPQLVFDTLGPQLTATGLPDLQIDRDAAVNSWNLSQQSFLATDCEVVEGCVFAPGERTLLRFDAGIENLGSTDLILGSPQGNPLFEYSSCHDHYHFESALQFELLHPDGTPVAVGSTPVIGRKQSFCMMDMEHLAGNEGQVFDCSNQGISAGWEDVYDQSLDCQWLDVTGVPGGSYLLRIVVNPDGILPDSNTAGKSQDIPVTLP